MPVGGTRHALPRQQRHGRGQGSHHRRPRRDRRHVDRAVGRCRPNRGSRATWNGSTGCLRATRWRSIMDALETDGGDWAAKELKTLRSKSPMTCELVLRQLSEGAKVGRLRRQHEDGISRSGPRHHAARFRRRRARADRRQDRRSDVEARHGSTGSTPQLSMRSSRRSRQNRNGSLYELRNDPRRKARCRDAGHAQPAQGAKRAEFAGSGRSDRCLRGL